ncbi:hypothetical protein N0V93_008376 [Gnomoniopsis smithogilvyi]|uniref:Clr5 domain-containing protein n=1 Tax=Gnomoniopsis smithogilvyi TaxID=1191159 RepID=A0A9W8YPX8_9PEZI|nr:hypothetical protein N0V93_008376 [Gnomoniopsis smithogilvyi]
MHEGYTLHTVMGLMESKYNFKATNGWILNPVVRPKTYKSRLRKWGCRKNIVLKTDQEVSVLGELATVTCPESHLTPKLLRLPNGHIVDTDRLAKHLNRKWTTRRHSSAFAVPLLKATRPPDVFYVPEKLYRNTRAYVLGRSGELQTSGNPPTTRGSSPHTIRWLSFAYDVHAAVVDRRYNDAILHMRNAPKELMNLLVHQPSLILSSLFRFITCIIRFLPIKDPQAQQFLKVIKSLLQYGASCLGSSEAAGGFPSEHPIRLILEDLARVEENELSMVVMRAWMVACVAGFDLMGNFAAVNGNSAWSTMAKGEGTSQLPPQHDIALDYTLERHEANGIDRMRLVKLVNWAFILRTLAEATGRERSPEESVMEALRVSHEMKYNLDENARLNLHQFFGLPLDNISSSRLVEFLDATPE